MCFSDYDVVIYVSHYLLPYSVALILCSVAITVVQSYFFYHLFIQVILLWFSLAVVVHVVLSHLQASHVLMLFDAVGSTYFKKCAMKVWSNRQT